MKTPLEDDALDRIARALHETAVRRVAPSTLRALRQASTVDRQPRRGKSTGFPGWALASACAAVVAVIVVVARPDPGTDASTRPEGTAQPLAAVDERSPLPPAGDTTLDEDPAFYLWLATTDVQPIAME